MKNHFHVKHFFHIIPCLSFIEKALSSWSMSFFRILLQKNSTGLPRLHKGIGFSSKRVAWPSLGCRRKFFTNLFVVLQVKTRIHAILHSSVGHFCPVCRRLFFFSFWKSQNCNSAFCSCPGKLLHPSGNACCLLSGIVSPQAMQELILQNLS